MKITRSLPGKYILPVFSSTMVLLAIAYLQKMSPYLFGVDGYYHIRIPYFIREFGLRYDFTWARFTSFAEHFSDKELLFHLLILPFTYLPADLLGQAKGAVVFFAFLFIAVFLFIQRKYVSPPLSALTVAALPFSLYFFVYINVLRPKTIAVTLVLILMYFLVEKKWLGVLAVSLLYPLSHISFPVVIVLSLGVEAVRYFHRSEICIRTILYSIVGTLGGIFIHPNYPDNLLSLYLNGFLVPWNAVSGGVQLSYGLEWNPVTTKVLFLSSPLFFAGLFFAGILVMTGRVRPGFPTAAFFFATCFFLFPSLFSYCYWYYTYPTGLIFLGMFFTDYLKERSPGAGAVVLAAGALLLIGSAVHSSKGRLIESEFTLLGERNLHYERVGRWMNDNLPAGETVFHTSWSDTPYFMAFNPKNNYLGVLDPIYMYYYDEEIYNLYGNLSRGQVADPAPYLLEVFGTRYGYAGGDRGLYRQVLQRPDAFTILFREPGGLVFKVDGNPVVLPTPPSP